MVRIENTDVYEDCPDGRRLGCIDDDGFIPAGICISKTEMKDIAKVMDSIEKLNNDLRG